MGRGIRFLELLEHIQPRTFLSLLAEEVVQFLRGLRQLLLNLTEPLLPFLDGAALGLGIEFLGLDVGGKLSQTRFQAGPFFLPLALFGRQLLQHGHLALLLSS